ncbi:alkaline phosphatase D family protein [Pseudalkalibacillus decolorationis]|uniref:alkaline phosphatase D family protein n=1 Tax=Pseudalkalibacillus decolorationis TaxID=163879 RepID=UPI002147DD3F|nr:alkaline phosphatase D family protein [Pseudalkalibacillus decolorationis]
MKKDHFSKEMGELFDLEKHYSSKMNRKKFLAATSKFAMLSLGATIASSLNANPVDAAPKFKEYPFTLGIASGDPLPDGVVLWTRLAPDPLNGGGMKKNHDVPVRWEVARDEGFRDVVQHGVEFARAALGHSVHVEVNGLQPNERYFYRFKVGNEMSPIGRTKTLPAFGADVSKMSFAVASCQHYESGYYTAYKRMAGEDLDLVLHLGDYIYEDGETEGSVRSHIGPEITTLDDYRNRYAQYRSDGDLREAHAKFPWVVVLDDHEVENNWAGEIPQNGQPVEPFIKRRADAFQAYYEHMPLRRSSMPNGSSIQLYRKFEYGNLVNFNILDTRQYRDDQANNDGWDAPNEESNNPNRTLLGDEQERWLFASLKNSQARWNVLGQQVFFAQRDYDFDPGEKRVSMDAWDGYPAARERVLNFVSEQDIPNLVVLTGDVHSNWANDIKSDFNDPNSKTLGVELVATSITSGRDGSDVRKNTDKILEENPHIKFFNNQRGYVKCTVTPEKLQADFRVLPYVTRPDAPISTRASLEVEHNNPGLKKIYDALVTT